jgi:hypothetical protein
MHNFDGVLVCAFSGSASLHAKLKSACTLSPMKSLWYPPPSWVFDRFKAVMFVKFPQHSGRTPALGMYNSEQQRELELLAATFGTTGPQR